MATVKQYIEKCSPFMLHQGSKDQYLNGCIEDLYLTCEQKIQSKMDNIQLLKDQITKLDDQEEADDGKGEEADGDDERKATNNKL